MHLIVTSSVVSGLDYETFGAQFEYADNNYHNAIAVSLWVLVTEEPFLKEDSCMSTHEILESYGMEATHGLLISRDGFLHLCPAIVYELDQKHCRQNRENKVSKPPTRFRMHGRYKIVP